VLIHAVDLGDITRHEELLQFAIQNFPDFDTFFLAYGSMLNQGDMERSAELIARQLHNDLTSAAALLATFANYFEARRGGCIAAITSVAGDRPRRQNYVYGAAKGALSYFLAGLRSRLRRKGVSVITIKPGPVSTPMTAHLRQSGLFAQPENVARAIYRALVKGSSGVLYTPSYWRYVMRGLRLLPQPMFERLAGK
jgi:short-subunit dehydrogenase